MNEKELLKEKDRICQKIVFCKKYSSYLIRISIGSIITTIFFVYLMSEVGIDLGGLSISKVSLTLLAISPTAIPLAITYLFYKQINELNETLNNINEQLKK